MTVAAQAELKIEGWRSGYASVENVLRHLQRKSSGYGAPPSFSSSAVGYAEIMHSFCRFSGRDPDELVAQPKQVIEDAIHSYLDSLLARGLSKNTVTVRRSFLLLHFQKNGFRHERELEIEKYHVPARYRKQPEYIPSSEEVLRIADAIYIGRGVETLPGAIAVILSKQKGERNYRRGTGASGRLQGSRDRVYKARLLCWRRGRRGGRPPLPGCS